MRLIDADALVAKLEDDSKHMEDNLAVMFTYAAINELKRAQTVDAVEVIRCKNCKHWMPYDWMFSEVWRSVNMDDYSDDEIVCAYCDMNMHANDFCSRAERRQT